MSIIALEGMRFFAYHGLFVEEHAAGNHFVVDVWMDSGGHALSGSDRIEDVIDYGQAYAVVAEEMKGERVNLLETLVWRIGNRLLEQVAEVVSIRVRVSKLAPPVGGECERSYIEHTFKR